jgi:hypothetical protein
MAAREEDKSMAGLLRRSLAQDAGAGSGSGDCPEPEILAAYFDHALDAEETARYDLHFSRCSHCREQLAAMARAGGVGDADAAGQETAGAWAWLTGPRWSMPAAAMLVALLAITGIALRMKKPVEPATQVAMVRPEALPPASTEPLTNSAPSPANAPATGAASSVPRAMDSIAVPPSAPGASRADAEGAPIARSGSGASREPGRPSRAVTRANSAARAGASGAKAATAQVNQPHASKPAPQTSSGMEWGAMRAGSAGNASGVVGGVASGSGGGVAGGTVNSADETATVTGPAPPVGAAEPTRVVPSKVLPANKAATDSDSYKSDAQVSVEAEPAPQPNARKSKKAATAPVAAPTQSAKAMNLAASQTTEAAALANLQQAQMSSNLMNLQIQTPDPKVLWMIAGTIEKSEDGGATWKPESPETRARIIAGSAPNVKICWLVGENGTILRTTNGAHWKAINPPAETDFVRVEATDALTATVTALDGRRFSTSDGGKSWNSLK